MTRYSVCLAVVAALIPACSGESTETALNSELADLTFRRANSAVQVRVVLECLAGGCRSAIDQGCTTTVEGSVITVDSFVTLRDSGESECTTDCRRVSMDCDPLALPDGEFEVRYGTRTHTLTVPLPLDGVTFRGN